MIIKRAEPKDINKISLLHKKAFDKTHFTANFSINLLDYYFDNLIKSFSFNYVLYEENILEGYLIGGIDLQKGVNSFIREHLLGVIKTLLMNPRFIPEKISELFGGTSSPESEKVPTIYIIAANPEFKGGAGKKLLEEFEKEIKSKNYKKYTLSVRKENIKAINFYKKNNFELDSESKQSYKFYKLL
jgi:ribosomal protein S18 acetylase RimI-like enzyme